jgi:hypothetical protein
MDIAETTAPRSDQQNYDDYLGGSKIVTVTEVKAGTAEQPVEIHLAEYPGRPYKPSKSMRRVLVQAWGSDSAPWPGRQIELYGDPTVRFGGTATGGIKISRLSHIEKPLSVNLTVTRGKRAPHKVEPLPNTVPTVTRDWLAELEQAGTDVTAIGALGQAASDAHAPGDVIAAIRAAFNAARGTST